MTADLVDLIQIMHANGDLLSFGAVMIIGIVGVLAGASLLVHWTLGRK